MKAILLFIAFTQKIWGLKLNDQNVCPEKVNISRSGIVWNNLIAVKGVYLQVKCCPDYGEEGNLCKACKPGTFGPDCKYSCPENYYGIQCKHQCVCALDELCNKTIGCIRQNDNERNKNETACPEGKFGLDCSNTCNCKEDQICNQTTDDCLCEKFTENCYSTANTTLTTSLTLSTDEQDTGSIEQELKQLFRKLVSELIEINILITPHF
ncbi:unnamed protein product [Mytilus coruscus]|uniref:MEGF10_11 n=1 Tax=Mytilus coruscus TaxID=42192 RepID=A0A6J8CIZ8_MYTCO|nr:unnamed protein product [Mytilus coruscus]